MVEWQSLCLYIFIPMQFAPHSFIDSPNHWDFQVLDEFMCWWEQVVICSWYCLKNRPVEWSCHYLSAVEVRRLIYFHQATCRKCRNTYCWLWVLYFVLFLRWTITILFNIVSSLFKSALEAFHWVHDFLFSKSLCQNCCIEYSKKPRDVEASQRKGGGVGKEKSLSLSASLSFTLTPTPRDDISTLSNLPQS